MCKQSQTARHVFVKLKEVQCKKETENVDLQNKSCVLIQKRQLFL